MSTHLVPANIAYAAYGIVSRPNLACHGIPGTSCSVSETSAAPSWLISAVLGRTRSEDASSSCDTTRETSGPPNSDSPLSTADRVAW